MLQVDSGLTDNLCPPGSTVTEDLVPTVDTIEVEILVGAGGHKH